MNPFPLYVKDIFNNFCLDIKSKFRYVRNIKKSGNFKIPLTYKKVFTEDFKTSEISK